jgi:hypothetical protein
VQAAVERFGGIDALRNNAGIGWTGRFEEVAPEQARRLFDVLLLGPTLMTLAVLPVLRRSGAGPSILFTASGLGLHGGPNISIYAAAKHAIVGLMRSLALELGPEGLRVNAVCPRRACPRPRRHDPAAPAGCRHVAGTGRVASSDGARPTWLLPMTGMHTAGLPLLPGLRRMQVRPLRRGDWHGSEHTECNPRHDLCRRRPRCLRRSSAGTVPDPPGDHRRAVPSGGLAGHHRASDRAADAGVDEEGLRRRQQARRGRQHRCCRGGQGSP